MRGIEAILSRIPEGLSGIYSWYRRFEISQEIRDDPEAFAKLVINEIYKPHCIPRTARIPPSHRIYVEADTVFRKRELLESFSADSSFRNMLVALLENSLLFQQPLYIGKSNNIKTRIKHHLDEGSDLRQRLYEADHNIEKCRLLVVNLTDSDRHQNLNNFNGNDEENFEDLNLEETEFATGSQEQLIEDILSRLFLPSFTIRYG